MLLHCVLSGLQWPFVYELSNRFFVSKQLYSDFGCAVCALFDKVSEDIQDRGINREIISGK